MRIDEAEVRYVALLANLELSDDEIVKIRTDLDGILTHIDRLKEIDTSGVEPMAQVLHSSTAGDVPLSDLRDDEIIPPLGTAVALANAPQPGAGYFKVPKIIER